MKAKGQIVFISVDPERDSPERLARIRKILPRRFHRRNGLRRGAQSAYRCQDSASCSWKVPQGSQGEDNYSVDHSAGVFIIDPVMRMVSVVTPPHSVRRNRTPLRCRQCLYRRQRCDSPLGHHRRRYHRTHKRSTTPVNTLRSEKAWVRQAPPGHTHRCSLYASSQTYRLTNRSALPVSKVRISNPPCCTRPIYTDGQARMRHITGDRSETGRHMFFAKPGGAHVMLSGTQTTRECGYRSDDYI